MIRVILSCHACQALAGVGLDVSHALWSVQENGGRVFGGYVITCNRCARGTR